jgi:hypothetical protein
MFVLFIGTQVALEKNADKTINDFHKLFLAANTHSESSSDEEDDQDEDEGGKCCVFVLIMSVKCVCVIVLAQRNAARGAASVVAEAAIRARVLMRTSSTFMSVSFTFSC